MKKKLLPLLALVLVAVLFGSLYFLTRPEGAEGEKIIHVQVVHKDGRSRDFSYETREEFLGPVLIDSGLIKGEQGPYGLYILEVDGQRAVFEQDNAYWALYVGQEYASLSADATPIHHGDTFRLVYTHG